VVILIGYFGLLIFLHVTSSSVYGIGFYVT